MARGIEDFSDGRIDGYVQYYTVEEDLYNRSVLYIRVFCWNYGEPAYSLDSAGNKETLYCDVYIHSNGEYVKGITEYYEQIDEGKIYYIVDEGSEDYVEDVEEEEDVEIIEPPVEELPDEPDTYPEPSHFAVEGGTVILEGLAYIEHDWFDGSGPELTITVIPDRNMDLMDPVQKEFTITLDNLYWSKSPSSIYIGTTNAQMGDDLLISLSKVDSTSKNHLYYELNGKRTLIKSSAGNSYIWAIPDMANLCSNASSAECAIICKTYTSKDYYNGASKVTFTLHVPDPTTPTIEDTDITLGNQIGISCPRHSPYFSIRLEYACRDSTGTILEGKYDSANWSPSYDIAKKIPSLTEASGTLTCTTLNGTAVVGTKTLTVKFIVPENETTKPAITSFTLSPVSDLGTTFSGLYLRGKTGLRAAISASSTYSSIKQYETTAGSVNATGNPAVIEVLADEGSVKVTAKVTDQRGFSRSLTKTITVLPYRKPRIIPYSGYSNIICERAKSTGELNPSGTYLAIKAGKSASSIVVNGVNKNNCSLKYRWKISSSDTFSSWITLLGEGSTNSEVSTLVGNIVSSLSTSYDVEIKAEDSVGETHILAFAIMTEAVSFVLYDGVDGAGFGKYPEEPHVVDIAAHMTLRVRGKLVVDGADWIDLKLASGINESVYSYGRKEDSGCHYQVTDGNHIYIAFNCAFSFAGSAKVINGTVIPAAHRPPRTVYTLCPINDRGIALVSANADGYIRVECVQKMTDSVQTGSAAVNWIDGYLDYWT